MQDHKTHFKTNARPQKTILNGYKIQKQVEGPIKDLKPQFKPQTQKDKWRVQFKHSSTDQLWAPKPDPIFGKKNLHQNKLQHETYEPNLLAWPRRRWGIYTAGVSESTRSQYTWFDILHGSSGFVNASTRAVVANYNLRRKSLQPTGGQPSDRSHYANTHWAPALITAGTAACASTCTAEGRAMEEAGEELTTHIKTSTPTRNGC